MPPALVLLHIERLPDDSLTRALMGGGWDHFGWGQDRHIFADIYDALNFNTEATGRWEKTPDLGRWPRPTKKAKDGKPKRRTVKEIFNQLKK